MNGFLELALWKVISQGTNKGGGGYFGSGRGWVPQVLRQKNIISRGSYGRGRAGHDSRGEPFAMEFQFPK
ncbi:hypothetical protein GOBAR_AA31005 [Gossypium barbadense]|uniref:Uncharacterized protein n=1 Tax=Gossypium barbadense TaxID=3634 RepID=A0A2P5WEZ2_GOSBA|nr:hypothetical protein GOBAR_AA31005 [Gossypium barbadense]